MLDAESELKEAASWAVMLMMIWRHDARRALIYVLSEQLATSATDALRWDAEIHRSQWCAQDILCDCSAPTCSSVPVCIPQTGIRKAKISRIS